MRSPSKSVREFATQGKRPCSLVALAPAVVSCLIAMGVAGVTLGLVHAARGESPDQGLVLPKNLGTDQPESIDGKLQQSREHVKAGDFPQAATAAIGAFRQAIREAGKTDPPTEAARRVIQNIVDYLLDMAQKAIDASELGVAQHCYNQVRSVKPRDWQALLGLAEVSRLGGRPWDAFQDYGRYLRLGENERPQDHKGELGMGLACLGLGKYSLAQDYLQRAVRLAPNNAEAAMGLARAYYGKNRFPKALPHAQRAVTLDDAAPIEKRHPEFRYWWALILKSNRQLDKAVAVAREFTDTVRNSIRDNPGDARLIDQLDAALELRLKLLQAQMETDQGGRDPQVRIEMARLVEDRGAIQQIRAYQQALGMLVTLAEEQSENVEVVLQVARLSRLVGKKDDAIAAYQKVLELSSGNETAKKVLREMGAPLKAPKPTPTTAPTTAPTTTTAPAKAPKSTPTTVKTTAAK